MEALPYSWPDVWALQAATTAMRTHLSTVRELISGLAESRAELSRRAMLSGWTGAAATAHRTALTRAAGRFSASTGHLEAVARPPCGCGWRP
jgi:hypothetical protein